MNPVVVRNLEIGVGMPKICVPIIEKKERDIIEFVRQLQDLPVDFVEWRADWFEGIENWDSVRIVLLQLRAILGDMPLLFTFRTRNEGGERELPYHQYAELLRQVAESKTADLIDVELFVDEKVADLIDALHAQGTKVIASNHDFVATPEQEEIVRRLCLMQEAGADIAKIALMPQNEDDVKTLLAATREMATFHTTTPVITMSMGELGVVSRVMGEKVGSAVTFGCVGQASAPGQMSVDILKEIMENFHRNEKQ